MHACEGDPNTATDGMRRSEIYDLFCRLALVLSFACLARGQVVNAHRLAADCGESSGKLGLKCLCHLASLSFTKLTLPCMHLPGFIGITQQDCESRQCCWQPVEAGFRTASNQPQCFHANEGQSEYELITTTPTGTSQQTHSAMYQLCCLRLEHI